MINSRFHFLLIVPMCGWDVVIGMFFVLFSFILQQYPLMFCGRRQVERRIEQVPGINFNTAILKIIDY
ncbi:hypothetical protein CSQ94_13825 [Janthinobacterium sp. BJB312]|nr:hypothetical protein CSQ94_13825 [Janthinobacterium sp. BJB312]